MPASRKRAADFTGQQQLKLQEERKTELLEASERIALVTSQQKAAREEIVDLTNSDEPLPAVEIRQAEVNTPFRLVRTNQDIDQMTYGREVLDPGDYNNPDHNLRRPAIMGPVKMYSFKEGQLTRIPREVADHLNDKGYLSYMSGA